MTTVIPEPAFSRDESWFRLVGYIKSVYDDGLVDPDLTIGAFVENVIDYAEMLESDRMRPVVEFIQTAAQSV